MHMLQCHPHPEDFSDESRSFHSCYFMGLQRKQGVAPNEAEQFDIRTTVEEFKHAVGMYTMWKPGMEIYVSHVKRKNIPNFVFPGGVRPARPIRIAGESGRVLKPKVPTQVEDNSPPQELVDYGKKRKRENGDMGANLRDSKSLARAGMLGELVYVTQTSNGSTSYSTKLSTNTEVSGNAESALITCIRQPQVPVQNVGDLEASSRCSPSLAAPPVSSSSQEDEKLAIEKIMSGPYVEHQAVPAELDELEDDPEYKNQANVFGAITGGSSMESSTTKASLVLSLTTTKSAGSCSSLQSAGTVEELEVLSSYPVTLYILIFVHSMLVSIYLIVFDQKKRKKKEIVALVVVPSIINLFFFFVILLFHFRSYKNIGGSSSIHGKKTVSFD